MVCVVKIGGSLAYEDQLLDWLNQILIHKHRQIVIVPGGGPFADQVRHVQSRWNSSDLAAHQMAILGMQQFGFLLADLRPQITLSGSVLSIRNNLKRGISPLLWMPQIEELNQARIPATWDITSDSLAAWLCQQLDVNHLFLIKSTGVINNQNLSDCDAQSIDIVDKAFSEMSAKCTCRITILGKQQFNAFHVILDG